MVQSRRNGGQRGRDPAAPRDRGRNVEIRDHYGPARGAGLVDAPLMRSIRSTPQAPGEAESSSLPGEAIEEMTVTIANRISMQDGRQLLAQCSLFRRFGPDERGALIGHAHMRKCAADETIFLMGSPGDSMMAVLSGQVRISVPSPDGKEIVLAMLGTGQIFGEVALLDGKERTADARATTECSLAVLERRDVLSFFERHPTAWPGLVEMLCDRLRTTDRQMAEVALL